MSDPAPYSTPPEQPKSNLTWLWVTLGVLLVLLIVCGGACGGCLFVANRAAKEGGQFLQHAVEMTQVQAQAQPAIAASEAVADKIGAITGQGVPEHVGAWVADAPTMTIRFEVNGEKGTATATVAAARGASAWNVTSFEVKTADGTTIDVPPPAEHPPELNFDIGPETPMPNP
jgi:hypothetical protein